MRGRLIAASAVVLTVLGGTAAYGAWSSSAALAAGGNIASGTFGVTATWSTPLDTTGMYPGQTRTGVLAVAASAGTTSRWVYTLGAPTFAGGLAASMTAVVYPSATCGGTALTLPWTQATLQAASATAQHCVAVTLGASAPSTSQGKTVTVTVPVTGENRSTT
ncbi:hypothetical protein [Cellulomonas alba]|uniref:Ribosomally synthesized peptide with SipW-like signal peptide n=1 Tax=Cellulomonas alba TaxID=3053467 RepID=A0ABT7SDY1_9CELL|nr:hypothetical protein [Cellulomonas alba]MDM7854396.1 hypothetical protein [Cellulomonas alba]